MGQLVKFMVTGEGKSTPIAEKLRVNFLKDQARRGAVAAPKATPVATAVDQPAAAAAAPLTGETAVWSTPAPTPEVAVDTPVQSDPAGGTSIFRRKRGTDTTSIRI